MCLAFLHSEQVLTITIRDLSLPTHIGVTDEERMRPQNIIANITYILKSPKVCTTDNIADTVDYDHVAALIRELAKTERKTLEKFAGDIARAVHALPHIAEVSVELRKHAIPDAAAVLVTLTQSR